MNKSSQTKCYALIREDKESGELWLCVNRTDELGGSAYPIFVDEIDVIREACEKYFRFER